MRTSGCKSYLIKAAPAGQERPRVPPRQGPYGAGGSEKRGRVMEPRNGERRGQPTVFSGRPAAGLGAPGRARRTPPGSESGAWLHQGHAGTGESHVSPCQTPGVGARGTQGPGVVWGLRPDHEPVRDATNTPKWARSRGASDKRSAPRRTWRQSERSRVPRKGGNRGPRDPREGRRRRASRLAGEHAGRDVEITNRHPTTPAECGAGRPRSRLGLDDPGPPERRGLPARGLSPHAAVQRPRD